MLTSKLPGVEVTHALRKVFLAEPGLTKINFVQGDADIGSYNLTSRKRMTSGPTVVPIPSISTIMDPPAAGYFHIYTPSSSASERVALKSLTIFSIFETSP
jgi:hypothetical protein